MNQLKHLLISLLVINVALVSYGMDEPAYDRITMPYQYFFLEDSPHWSDELKEEQKKAADIKIPKPSTSDDPVQSLIDQLKKEAKVPFTPQKPITGPHVRTCVDSKKDRTVKVSHKPQKSNKSKIKKRPKPKKKSPTERGETIFSPTFPETSLIKKEISVSFIKDLGERFVKSLPADIKEQMTNKVLDVDIWLLQLKDAKAKEKARNPKATQRKRITQKYRSISILETLKAYGVSQIGNRTSLSDAKAVDTPDSFSVLVHTTPSTLS